MPALCRFLRVFLVAAAVSRLEGQIEPPLPREIMPFRTLPYLPGIPTPVPMVSGNTCLFPAGGGTTFLEVFRYNGSQWTEIPNPFPVISWPTGNREGLLEFRSGVAGNFSRTVIEADTGAVLWRDIPFPEVRDFDHSHYVSFSRDSMTVYERNGVARTYPFDQEGLIRSCRIQGGEVAYVADAPKGTSMLIRRDLATGNYLEVKNLNRGTLGMTITGFHSGRILLTHDAFSRSSLYMPGSEVPIVPVLPPAYLPGPTPYTFAFGDLISLTPEGAWFHSGRAGVGRRTYLHLNLAVPGTPFFDRVIAGGSSLGGDGAFGLVYRAESGESFEQAQGGAGIPPVITLGEGRAKESAGYLEIPVKLDRAAAQVVRVRLATLPLGTATSADYIAADSWVEIPAGQLEGTFKVTLLPDTLPEANESFGVELREATGGTFLPGTRTSGVIEASGVQRRLVEDLPVVAHLPSFPNQVTGGDGLLYRRTKDDGGFYSAEVVDPATSAVLETLELHGYSPGGTLSYLDGSSGMETTADGARLNFTEKAKWLAWDLSSRRSQAAVEMKVNPPTEGGLAGHLEFRTREASLLPVKISWEWSAPLRSVGGQSSLGNPAYTPIDSIEVPADGSLVAKPVFMRSWWSTDRKLPVRLATKDATNRVIDIQVVEPVPGGFQPVRGTLLENDPSFPENTALLARNIIGDRLYVGAKHFAEPWLQKGAVQVFDTATGRHLHTIMPPASLTHRGFGSMIVGDDKDLFILASADGGEPGKKTKFPPRTLFVYSQATGQLRATIKGNLRNFAEEIHFSDNYLALLSPGYYGGRGQRNAAGGVQLYRRSDYKLAGKLKLPANGVRYPIALSEDALFLGVPISGYIPPGKKKRDMVEKVGSVLVFPTLPKLKKALVIHSPAGVRGGGAFGSYLHLETGGDLIVSEPGRGGDMTSLVHRIDLTGTRAAVSEPMVWGLFPRFGHYEADGVAADTTPRLYDVATRSPLVEIGMLDGGLLGSGNVFIDQSHTFGPLTRVPLQYSGNFDLWVRFGGQETAAVADPSADGNGNGKPDIEDYIIAQTGGLPNVEARYDTAWYTDERLRTMSFKAAGDLPPDATMLVEYSHHGGPWKLAAVKRGAGKLVNVEAGVTDANGWTAPLEQLIINGHVEVRVSYSHSQAAALGKDEFRTLLRD